MLGEDTYSTSQTSNGRINNPISITHPGAKYILEGETMSPPIQPSDPEDDPGTFADTALTAAGLSATIQWGDGSSSTATAANGGISDGTFSEVQKVSRTV